MTTDGTTKDCVGRFRVRRALEHDDVLQSYLVELDAGSAAARLVTLDLVRREHLKDSDFRARFLDQAAATLHLDHPNLVKILEVVAEPGCCGLTTEWVDGRSLSSLINRAGRASVPLPVHLHILCEVLAGLEYAHEADGGRVGEQGIVHRSVCPDNVLVTSTGGVKLRRIGFAQVARVMEQTLEHPMPACPMLAYASPELLLGYPVGPGGDVYAVGVMLWEALAGRRRVFGDTTSEVADQRKNGTEPYIEQIVPQVPGRLATVCRRALAVNPRDRYPTVAELREDLQGYVEDVCEADAKARADELREWLKRLDEDAAAEPAPEDGVEPRPRADAAESAPDTSPSSFDDAETAVRARTPGYLEPRASFQGASFQSASFQSASFQSASFNASKAGELDTGRHAAFALSLVPRPIRSWRAMVALPVALVMVAGVGFGIRGLRARASVTESSRVTAADSPSNVARTLKPADPVGPASLTGPPEAPSSPTATAQLVGRATQSAKAGLSEANEDDVIRAIDLPTHPEEQLTADEAASEQVAAKQVAAEEGSTLSAFLSEATLDEREAGPSLIEASSLSEALAEPASEASAEELDQIQLTALLQAKAGAARRRPRRVQGMAARQALLDDDSQGRPRVRAIDETDPYPDGGSPP